MLVEGGSKIFTSFINENLADEIMIFRSNYFIGSKGKDMIEKIYTTNNTSGSFILKKNFQEDGLVKAQWLINLKTILKKNLQKIFRL